MKRNACIVSFLVLTAAILGGCSRQPPAQASNKAEAQLQKIQGKAQVLIEEGGASDAALNAGGSSIYLWEGTRRYRLFLRTPVEVVHGSVYVAEGVYAQKAIDDIGDPDQGKNGYPLMESCQKVVRMAWTGLAFDTIDAQAQVLRARVKRYPARPVFLVTRIRPASTDETAATAAAKKDTTADGKEISEVAVPAEKQKTFLLQGPSVLPAPLWEPEGGTARCKVIIDQEGKISDLETGAQLCETVAWSDFRYQPPVQKGRPVKVSTEVEVRFEARK